MSELKVYRNLTTYIADYGHQLEVYDKSEADKVIEDLEESHKKEVEQLLIKIEELKADYKEACDRLQTANLIRDEQIAATRHQKYKRCLDKAEMCKARYDEEDARVNGRGASWDYISNEMKYWERWHKRWLELTEKFKEAKL